MGKKWVPIESNPEVLNEFSSKLGVDTSAFSFCDVYGLDKEVLDWVPVPVKAVLMVYPITSATEAAKEQEEVTLLATGQSISDSLWFTKQTISNACGTIALLHAFANNRDIQFSEGSFLARFFAASAAMNPDERARFLEYPQTGEPDIEEAHQGAAAGGQTEAPQEDEEVLLHYVCFIHMDGCLYELDGRKFGAINHGTSSEESLLVDTVEVVKQYIETTKSINFSLMALSKTPKD